MDYKDELPAMASPIDQGFLNWVNDPAVYMPQVLAIVDQRLSCTDGSAPTLISTIPNQIVSAAGVPVVVALAPFFSGGNLTYSISVTPALTGGDSITINPTTGELTLLYGGDGTRVYAVTVTATNGCGSVSSTFGVLMFEIG